MYPIHFYKDRNGHEPVREYIETLSINSSKDSRIKLHKIQDYLTMLKNRGTMIGEPFIKHLEGEIWELRPLRDRILFAAWLDDGFILLHHFVKKTQKTPRRELMTLEKNPAIGSSWDDLQKTIFTKEEIAASELRVALMLEIIDARKKQGISQKKLEELSGVKQPVIARMEIGKTAPQLDTVLKILASLGKTLAVVPLDSHVK